MAGGIGDFAGDLYNMPMQTVTFDPNAGVAGISGTDGNVAIPPLGAAPTQPDPSAALTDQQAVAASAARLGLEPREWAALMHFESGMNPNRWGGAKNPDGSPRHVGLIQFGPDERKQFGVTGQESLQEQLPKAEAFLLKRGYQPGSGLLNAYSTVNAGSPGKFNASDAGNGGTWGTVADKVNSQFGDHYTWADKWLGGAGQGAARTPGAANPGMSVGSTATGGTFGLTGIQARGAPVVGQAAAPDVASLGAQPMTAMAPTAQTMMPAVAPAQPEQSLLQKLMGNNSLSSLTGAAGAAGKAGQQKQQQAGGGMQIQPYKPQTMGLQQAKSLFDPSRFYQALQAAGVRTGGNQ